MFDDLPGCDADFLGRVPMLGCLVTTGRHHQYPLFVGSFSCYNRVSDSTATYIGEGDVSVVVAQHFERGRTSYNECRVLAPDGHAGWIMTKDLVLL